MKKLIVFVAMTCMTLAGFAQEDVKDKNKGEMKFEHTRHDFGTFAQDTAVVTHEFVFTNVGKSPLVIHQANASCGCTVPEYTLEPIAPGKQGRIKITYNGKGRRPGVFRKSITIHHNGKQTPARIYIEGEMIGDELPIKEVPVVNDSTMAE